MKVMRHLEKSLASLVFGGGFGACIHWLAGFNISNWQYWVLLLAGLSTSLVGLFGNDESK
jgi:hypothetical protein